MTNNNNNKLKKSTLNHLTLKYNGDDKDNKEGQGQLENPLTTVIKYEKLNHNPTISQKKQFPGLDTFPLHLNLHRYLTFQKLVRNEEEAVKPMSDKNNDMSIKFVSTTTTTTNTTLTDKEKLINKMYNLSGLVSNDTITWNNPFIDSINTIDSNMDYISLTCNLWIYLLNNIIDNDVDIEKDINRSIGMHIVKLWTDKNHQKDQKEPKEKRENENDKYVLANIQMYKDPLPQYANNKKDYSRIFEILLSRLKDMLPEEGNEIKGESAIDFHKKLLINFDRLVNTNTKPLQSVTYPAFISPSYVKDLKQQPLPDSVDPNILRFKDALVNTRQCEQSILVFNKETREIEVQKKMTVDNNDDVDEEIKNDEMKNSEKKRKRNGKREEKSVKKRKNYDNNSNNSSSYWNSINVRRSITRSGTEFRKRTNSESTNDMSGSENKVKKRAARKRMNSRVNISDTSEMSESESEMKKNGGTNNANNNNNNNKNNKKQSLMSDGSSDKRRKKNKQHKRRGRNRARTASFRRRHRRRNKKFSSSSPTSSVSSSAAPTSSFSSSSSSSSSPPFFLN